MTNRLELGYEVALVEGLLQHSEHLFNMSEVQRLHSCRDDRLSVLEVSWAPSEELHHDHIFSARDGEPVTLDLDRLGTLKE